VQTPEHVAAAVLRAVRRPRRHARLLGATSPLVVAGFAALPALYDALVGPLVALGALSREPVEAHAGSVFAPAPGGEGLRGRWGRWRRRR